MGFEHCEECEYYLLSVDNEPCRSCVRSGVFYKFIPKNPPEQPTTPPIPPVNQPKTGEEINHPTRYAGGKYECIDVMIDVFGKDAVKNFCKLNAFKYLWREQNKNGVEDLKKAMFYMDYYIKLTEEENETDK